MRRLLLLLLVLPCLGFEWPGRLYRLQHELTHAEPTQRKELVRQLGQYSAEAAKEPLLLALEDADSAVRLEAAAVAGRVRLREAVPILLDWLDDKETDTRRSAAAALGEIKEPRALAALVRALGDASGEVRRAAVVSLGQLGVADAVVPLLGRLEDTDLGARIEAVAALGALRDARAVVPLLGTAVDPAADVRVAALHTLGRIADARALPALTRALADDVDDVRLAAAAALGRLGDRTAVRTLKVALERADPRLGQAIVAALGSIDDDDARGLLISQLQLPALRAAATRSLVQQARKLARRQGPEPAAAGATARAGAEALVVRLGAALHAGGPDEKVAAAESLTQIADVAPIDAALPALLAALPAADAKLTVAIVDALAASGAPDALMPLLERLGQGTRDAPQPVLHALLAYFEHAQADGRAADPLLARLPQVSAAQQVQVVELLGHVGAPRAVPALIPLLDQKDASLRVAVVQALGKIGAPEAAAALLPLIDSSEARMRLEVARALRTTAGADTVQTLLGRLTSEQPADDHALLIALGGALARLSRQTALPRPLADAAMQAITALAAGDDDELADRAVDALALWAPQGALERIASNLRLPSSRRRATAVHALGQLGDPQARQVLRYVLQHGSTREAAAAAAALGEVGDQRDVNALVKATKRMHWPVPGAAVYALERMAARGVWKPHSAMRQLCELGHSREPYIRANVAAALALLGAAPCDEGGPDPLRWLEPQHASIVREAAARWAHAAVAAGRLEPARANDALESCASSDVEPFVRAACAALPAARNKGDAADVYAHASDGVTLKRDALVALHLANGAVFLGYTDHNGHLRLDAAPTGALRLEDPGLVPLEPPG